MSKKIYVASSWKNAETVRELAETLIHNGFQVYDFTNSDLHYSFNLNALTNAKEVEYIQLLEDFPESRKAFAADKAGLDWADTLIMLLPCGRSSHLETGYAIGKGKRVFIYGDLPLGEFDVMYHLADGWFHKDDLVRLLSKLKETKQ